MIPDRNHDPGIGESPSSAQEHNSTTAQKKHVNGATAPRADHMVLKTFFAASDLAKLRRQVARHARTAGLCPARLDEFVLAVNEIATNAVVHGGGRGHLELNRTDAALRCTIVDQGPGLAHPDPCAPHPPGEEEGGRGLQLARAFVDDLTLTNGAAGTTVTLIVLLD
ncbi:hypothetical protein GCM10010358_72750 [Streptomyces minutiscleroticus]|uniref:Histidine kinase/HSP90-like ATPase domain-containing protein n=1 Tax=Streptomyces minutiscleroticus TaxID=68238 RepID=A0A918P070_9ACTN|nr:ATP-binding protein [Streptomyces minutiscleroticus]GGY09346.1 hypothetical protein GCM10010358_72750 [Streptomyces minutiscleroticus]